MDDGARVAPARTATRRRAWALGLAGGRGGGGGKRGVKEERNLASLYAAGWREDAVFSLAAGKMRFQPGAGKTVKPSRRAAVSMRPAKVTKRFRRAGDCRSKPGSPPVAKVLKLESG